MLCPVCPSVRLSVCLSVVCQLVLISLSLSLSLTHIHKHTHISLFLALGFNFYLYYMRLSIYYMFNVTRTNIFIKPQLKRTFKIIKNSKKYQFMNKLCFFTQSPRYKPLADIPLASRCYIFKGVEKGRKQLKTIQSLISFAITIRVLCEASLKWSSQSVHQ